MDVRSWLKDTTKKHDVAPEDVPPMRQGWQSPPTNPFGQSFGILVRIYFVWFGLEITGLRKVIGLSPDFVFVILGLTVLAVCLYYLYPYIRLGVSVMSGRIPRPESAPAGGAFAIHPDAHTERVEADYRDVYVGDDGELIFRPESPEKRKREGL
jgi:hypothetical protein